MIVRENSSSGVLSSNQPKFIVGLSAAMRRLEDPRYDHEPGRILALLHRRRRHVFVKIDSDDEYDVQEKS